MSKDACKGNVRFAAIGRTSDRVLISTYLHYTAGPDSKKYLAVSQKVLNSDKVLCQKCANVPNAVEDSSCLMQADDNYMYLALPVFVEKSYPERTAFELLRLIRKEFLDKEAAGATEATENSLSKASKVWMTKLCAKYDDLSSVNKVSQVKAQVEDVKMVMESNVQTMLANQEKVEDIEDKAENIKNEALKFKTGATSLANKMWWQNMKLMAIIGCVAFFVLLFIVLSLCPPCRGGR